MLVEVPAHSPASLGMHCSCLWHPPCVGGMVCAEGSRPRPLPPVPHCTPLSPCSRQPRPKPLCPRQPISQCETLCQGQPLDQRPAQSHPGHKGNMPTLAGGWLWYFHCVPNNHAPTQQEKIEHARMTKHRSLHTLLFVHWVATSRLIAKLQGQSSWSHPPFNSFHLATSMSSPCMPNCAHSRLACFHGGFGPFSPTHQPRRPSQPVTHLYSLPLLVNPGLLAQVKKKKGCSPTQLRRTSLFPGLSPFPSASARVSRSLSPSISTSPGDATPFLQPSIPGAQAESRRPGPKRVREGGRWRESLHCCICLIWPEVRSHNLVMGLG